MTTHKKHHGQTAKHEAPPEHSRPHAPEPLLSNDLERALDVPAKSAAVERLVTVEYKEGVCRKCINGCTAVTGCRMGLEAPEGLPLA